MIKLHEMKKQNVEQALADCEQIKTTLEWVIQFGPLEEQTEINPYIEASISLLAVACNKLTEESDKR